MVLSLTFVPDNSRYIFNSFQVIIGLLLIINILSKCQRHRRPIFREAHDFVKLIVKLTNNLTESRAWYIFLYRSHSVWYSFRIKINYLLLKIFWYFFHFRYDLFQVTICNDGSSVTNCLIIHRTTWIFLLQTFQMLYNLFVNNIHWNI